MSQGITISGSKFPECTTAQLESLDPAAAQAACGNTASKKKNALIATGTATAQIGTTARPFLAAAGSRTIRMWLSSRIATATTLRWPRP